MSNASPRAGGWGWVVGADAPAFALDPTRESWRRAMVLAALESGARCFYVPSSPSTARSLDEIARSISGTAAERVDLVFGVVRDSVLPRRGEIEGTQRGILRFAELGPELTTDPSFARWERAVEESRIDGWGVDRSQSRPTRSELEQDAAAGARFVRLPGNLLSPAPERAAISTARACGLAVLLSDPFAGGRLNGEWLRTSPVERPSLRGPPAFSSLQRGWASTLRLGFLTEDRGRTLAQAAFQYASALGEGVTVLVEALTRDDLAEIAAALRGVPLTQEQRTRAARIADGAPRA